MGAVQEAARIAARLQSLSAGRVTILNMGWSDDGSLLLAASTTEGRVRLAVDASDCQGLREHPIPVIWSELSRLSVPRG